AISRRCRLHKRYCEMMRGDCQEESWRYVASGDRRRPEVASFIPSLTLPALLLDCYRLRHLLGHFDGSLGLLFVLRRSEKRLNQQQTRPTHEATISDVETRKIVEVDPL